MMIPLLIYCMVYSPLPGDSGGDIIVEVEGCAESVAFSDLDGDELNDLIVLASPREESDKPFAPVQVFFQQEDRSFQRAHVPEEMLKDIFLVDLGNFTSDPGCELMLLDTQSMHFVHIGKDRKAVGSAELSLANSLFHPTSHAAPHLLNFTCDIDGNGYDDPVIPTAMGHAVIFSLGDGTFQDPVHLPGMLEWSIQYSDNSFFSLMTLAGKIQALTAPGKIPILITEKGGKLIGYEFDRAKKTFMAMESLHSSFGSYTPRQEQGTIQYSGIIFTGVSEIGHPSFVRSQRRGKSGLLAELDTTHTVYELELNRQAKKLEIFPLQKIVTDGISAPPVFSDLDSDGHEDLVLIYVKTSILTKLLEFFLDRVVITCQAHLFEPDEGRYSFAPGWSEDVSVPANSFRKIGSEGLIQFNGDYSGDGRPDMVVYDSDRLLIKRGERSEGFFSTEEVSFRSRPFFQIGHPFPGPVFCRNVDRDDCPEIITFGDHIVRIIHVH